MRPTNHSILLGLAALASFVSAAPQKNTGAGVHIIGIGNLLDIPVDKVDPNTLWRSSKSGDRVRLSVSDDKITYGNAGPWQIMEGFRQACKSALCPASFNVPAEFPAFNHKGKSTWQLKVSVVDGTMSSEHVEAVAGAMEALLFYVKESSEVPLELDGAGCQGHNCRRSDVLTRRSDLTSRIDDKHIWRHVGPSRIKMEMREKPDKGVEPHNAPLIFSVMLAMEMEDGGAGNGMCGVLKDFGAGVAGAVNPWIGAVGGGLGTILCLIIDQ